MKKIAFYTLGCRANQAQTESIKSQLLVSPSELAGFNDVADIYVINTCTVTQDADRKSLQAIRRALRQNPAARIIVTGCYARLESESLRKSFPNIEIENFAPFSPRPSFLSPRIRANLMIQDGCENFCAYCIVPYARGKVQSKALENIVTEGKALVQSGAREIVLTGINLGAFGKDFKGVNLNMVLQALSKIDNLFRIRLSSIEPMYLSRELIDAIAANNKVCRYLHIPLQSGDNNILKAMNRNYSAGDYLGLIDYVRAKIPDCGISTDIIVGFPGEGEKEFKNSQALINRIKFSRLHIFPYSKRKGTAAAEMPHQIGPAEKKARCRALQETHLKLMSDFALQYISKRVEILVEQKGVGLTSNFIRVLYPGAESEVGTLKKLKIKALDQEDCLAE